LRDTTPIALPSFFFDFHTAHSLRAGSNTGAQPFAGEQVHRNPRTTGWKNLTREVSEGGAVTSPAAGLVHEIFERLRNCWNGIKGAVTVHYPRNRKRRGKPLGVPADFRFSCFLPFPRGRGGSTWPWAGFQGFTSDGGPRPHRHRRGPVLQTSGTPSTKYLTEPRCAQGGGHGRGGRGGRGSLTLGHSQTRTRWSLYLRRKKNPVAAPAHMSKVQPWNNLAPLAKGRACPSFHVAAAWTVGSSTDKRGFAPSCFFLRGREEREGKRYRESGRANPRSSSGRRGQARATIGSARRTRQPGRGRFHHQSAKVGATDADYGRRRESARRIRMLSGGPPHSRNLRGMPFLILAVQCLSVSTGLAV